MMKFEVKLESNDLIKVRATVKGSLYGYQIVIAQMYLSEKDGYTLMEKLDHALLKLAIRKRKREDKEK
jgi:hypothetical protein